MRARVVALFHARKAHIAKLATLRALMPVFGEQSAQIAAAVLAVFGVIFVGAIARRLNWLTESADKTLLDMLIRVLLPCLIVDTITGNEQLRDPTRVIMPPIVGFLSIALGLVIGFLASRLPTAATGLRDARQKRTFAFCVGIFNYGYIPLPLIAALYGEETVGVLLVHNVGVEIAFWTIGLVVLAGGLHGQWWKKLLNPPLFAVMLAVALNATGPHDYVPRFVGTAVSKGMHMIGVTAVPIGLLLIGATMADLVKLPRRGEGRPIHRRVGWRVIAWGAALRLVAIPALMVLIASVLPVPDDLKRVIVVEAAMPAAVFPVVMARHYDGDPATALRVILSTSAISLVTIVVWIDVGMRAIGLPLP